jgi:hypothetical protein
LQQLALHQL